MTRCIVIAGVLLLCSISAQADEVVFEKRTVLHFDSDLIDGRLDNPEVCRIDVQQHDRRSLIKIRSSFREEILRSLSR